MNRLLRCFFILLIVPIVSCNDENCHDVSICDGVLLRLKNNSSVDFIQVTVSSGGGSQTFVEVDANEFSDYIPYDFIYRYGFLQVITNTDTLILQPIDYVGETKLVSGKYTYALDLTGPSGAFDGLTFDFIKD